MEKACERDLWCRLYMQGMRPDHATFGRFLQQVGESRIAMMFKGVVESLYNLGFIEFDEVAHDGTKVGGVADRKKNVNREEVKGLAAKALAHYREVREGRVRKRLGKGVEEKERKKALKDACREDNCLSDSNGREERGKIDGIWGRGIRRQRASRRNKARKPWAKKRAEVLQERGRVNLTDRRVHR